MFAKHLFVCLCFVFRIFFLSLSLPDSVYLFGIFGTWCQTIWIVTELADNVTKTPMMCRILILTTPMNAFDIDAQPTPTCICDHFYAIVLTVPLRLLLVSLSSSSHCCINVWFWPHQTDIGQIWTAFWGYTDGWKCNQYHSAHWKCCLS